MAFDTCRHLELGFVVVYDRDVLGRCPVCAMKESTQEFEDELGNDLHILREKINSLKKERSILKNVIVLYKSKYIGDKKMNDDIKDDIKDIIGKFKCRIKALGTTKEYLEEDVEILREILEEKGKK